MPGRACADRAASVVPPTVPPAHDVVVPSLAEPWIGLQTEHPVGNCQFVAELPPADDAVEIEAGGGWELNIPAIGSLNGTVVAERPQLYRCCRRR